MTVPEQPQPPTGAPIAQTLSRLPTPLGQDHHHHGGNYTRCAGRPGGERPAHGAICGANGAGGLFFRVFRVASVVVDVGGRSCGGWGRAHNAIAAAVDDEISAGVVVKVITWERGCRTRVPCISIVLVNARR